MGSTTAVGVASPYLPPCTPPPPSSSGRSSSCKPLSSTFYTLPYALYARPRCGRRRLGQVRLSLGFNIGENTGFYLIVRYVLCPFRAFTGQRKILGTSGCERVRAGESPVTDEARCLSRERERNRKKREEQRREERRERERMKECVRACVRA